MSDPLTDPVGAAKTIAQSLTLRGALAMALAFVAGRLGVSVPDDQMQAFADALVQIAFYGGLLAVGVGRAHQGAIAMSRFVRAAVLAIAITATPACATFATQTANVQALRSIDQNAYLVIGAFALKEATRFVRDPRTPKAVKVALGKAEAAATASVELVKVAAVAYRKARDGQSQAALTRAVADAQAPVAALSALLEKK